MKPIIRNILMAMPLLGLMSSCSEKEEIVFESELPQFEVRDNAILLEVIPPLGTAADDNLYIVGAFNGGEEQAVGNLQWQLEKAAEADKWGIYILPTDYVGGKTLADGFYFVSEKQGVERTLKNGDAMHTLDAKVGTRTNVTVDRWAAYFETADETEDDEVEKVVEHDGYVVYVVDQTSWGGALALYMWGDTNDLNGGWPGMAPTGTQTIDGVTYTYFDMGESNTGLGENLIFNNNGGGTQLSDYAYTIDHDIYLVISDSGVSEYDPTAAEEEPTEEPSEEPAEEPSEQPAEEPETPEAEQVNYRVYVIDETGWDAITMYMWGDVNDLNGGWPGMAASGTTEIDGQTYIYFDFGAENVGLGEHLIFNNNGGGIQLDDFYVSIDRDYYLRVTADGVSEIVREAE